MKHAISVVLWLTLVGAAPPSEPPPKLQYDVTAVKRKLLLAEPDGERQLDAGDRRYSGDELRTGSRSSADLEVRQRAAAFHIGAKTEFRLAHGQPGVLLAVDRGSVRGVFNPLPEGDERERLVTTPSAVLAVRGTQYGIEVKKNGDTSLTVFAGEVEVRPFDSSGVVVRIRAGQATRIGLGKPPAQPWSHGVTTRDWDRGRRATSPYQSGVQSHPSMGTGNTGTRGSSGAQSSQGGSKRRGG
jgi:hypothetical protein